MSQIWGISIAKYIKKDNKVKETLAYKAKDYEDGKDYFEYLADKNLPVYFWYAGKEQCTIIAESYIYNLEYKKVID